MHKILFAALAAFAFAVSGCGDKTPPAPPAGADKAETPDLEIETGIEVPGESSTDEGQATTKDAATDDTKKDEASN